MCMKIVHTISELRDAVSAAKSRDLRVAFVPTMGNLHEGHLSLVDTARQHGDYVVASIFVNPMQFGKNEDLDAYPRTLEEDATGLSNRQCDLLFAPNVSEVYPQGLIAETRVDVPEVSEGHCGASRAGHFVGVATVVSKLFNMVQPDVAIFGEKDFQQLAVIRKMVNDLCFPIDIIGVPTARENSGLARSSRNGYLSDEEKALASKIYEVLQYCSDQLRNRSNALEDIRLRARELLSQYGFEVDYINFAHPTTLKPANQNDAEVVVLVAALLGTTRLIDNVSVKR